MVQACSAVVRFLLADCQLGLVWECAKILCWFCELIPGIPDEPRVKMGEICQRSRVPPEKKFTFCDFAQIALLTEALPKRFRPVRGRRLHAPEHSTSRHISSLFRGGLSATLSHIRVLDLCFIELDRQTASDVHFGRELTS
eukprot:1391484-Amorphochlora_amoeboformis.AAC.2